MADKGKIKALREQVAGLVQTKDHHRSHGGHRRVINDLLDNEPSMLLDVLDHYLESNTNDGERQD